MIKQHPKEATLAEFANGTLDEGRRVVIAQHVMRCQACRDLIAAFECAGGEMLENIEPAPMAADASAKALARVASVTQEPAVPAQRDVSADQDKIGGYPLGPWRWVAPGLQYRSVGVPASETAARVFMLKAAPGIKLPPHRHTGTELTTVLSGAFIHEGGRYGAGDCDDADMDDLHSPVVDTGEVCICLVAMEGGIKLNSMLGRLLQPLIRI
jgi:putative transcriptional regulator